MTDDEWPWLDRRSLLLSFGAVTTAGLAGCSDSNKRYASVPVVLSSEATDAFKYEEITHDRLVEERSESVGPLDGSVVVESYIYAYDTGERRDLIPAWPQWESPPVGILTTPRVEEAGQELNPLATTPLDELLVGSQGQDLLASIGIIDAGSNDIEWLAPPEQIESETSEFSLFEGESAVERYLGVLVEADGPERAVLIDAVRGSRDGDEVIVAAGEQRALMADETNAFSGSECETLNCLNDELRFEERTNVAERITDRVVPCPAFEGVDPSGRNAVDLDNCVSVSGGSSGGSDDSTVLSLDVTNVRLVQRVEETVVTQSGGSSTYTEPDPPLVADDQTAVAFDLAVANADGSVMDDWDSSVQVDIERRFAGGSTASDRFFISNEKAKDILDGTDPRAVFHHLAPERNSATNPPVFEADSDLGSVQVSISAQDDDDLQWSVTGDDVTLRRGANKDYVVEDLRPLRVGFIAVNDYSFGDKYGTSNGELRDYKRTVESAVAYLRRVYPGKLVAYRHTEHEYLARDYGIFCTDNCTVKRHMERANDLLNRVATDPSYPSNGASFPGGGDLYGDLSQSAAVSDLKNNGFDVVVAIVPGVATGNSDASSYYDYYGFGAVGLAWDDPAAAVSSIGVNPTGNDQGVSQTAAQEIGHYFQDDYLNPTGHPMAQRDDESVDARVNGIPVDGAHARHQNSDLRDRDTTGDGNNDVDNPPDAPGVVSTAYALPGRLGDFSNMQQYTNSYGVFTINGPSKGASSIGKVPSYMSYTGNADQAWADARIHTQLIDSGWNPGGTSGSGNARYMVSGSGRVTDAGTIEYEDVSAFPGIDEYTDRDGAPVTVELLDPDDVVLEEARVPREAAPTHGDESVEAPSFTLPFDEAGVRIRTTVEERPTDMNPIVRSVEDGVARVPTAGIRGEPAAAQTAVATRLEEVADAMAVGAYGTAADRMDEPVRDRIREYVREYDAALNQPTLAELLALVDEMVRRLRTLAEQTA